VTTIHNRSQFLQDIKYKIALPRASRALCARRTARSAMWHSVVSDTWHC